MNENIDCGTFECGILVVAEPTTPDPTVRAQPIAPETVSN